MPANPSTVESHRARGLEFRKLGQLEAAIREFQAALRLNPQYVQAHFNIAAIRLDQGHADEAARLLRDALAIKPDYYHALPLLATALRRLGRLAEAAAACREAIRLKPDFVDAHLQLATTLHAARRMSEARTAFERALELNPRDVQTLNNYANLLMDLDEPSAAIEKYERAIAIAPDRAELFNNLANVLKSQARIDEAIDNYRRTLALKPDVPAVHSNLLLTLNSHPRSDAGLLADHVAWANRHAARFYPNQRPEVAPPSGRRIRVGYVSADFRKHSVAYFFEPLLVAHDRSRFEIFCYSNTNRSDEVTARLRSQSEHWRELAGLSDDRVAEMIRSDGIDILVDLNGHTANHRLLVFARRPAPVQVTYLGYPNTTGLATIDYRLTDADADPPGMTDAHHTERLVRLPDGFLCYKPPLDSPPPRPPVSGDRPITFGSFNNFAKVTPAIIALWARILGGVPGSCLLLKAETLADAATRERVFAAFESHRVQRSRIELLGREPSFLKHLLTYHRVDIGLDTFPYHGTTTTCEAMWMGVPVITLAGRAHVSRVGVSLLRRAGLEHLIADSPDAYASLAIQLAATPDALAANCSDRLRHQLQQTPLLNASAFTASVEAAFQQMLATPQPQ